MPAQSFTPLYTTFESVRVRLAGKVAVQKDATQELGRSEMPLELFQQMVVDAETAVEQDLRRRYAIPFRSIKNKTWEGLPDHSRRALRTIVDQKAVILILQESFGSGAHINADGYLKNSVANYELLLRRLLGQDMEGEEYGEKRFRQTPPLEDLMLAATNINDTGALFAPSDANDRSGYRGPSSAEYAAGQINDPRVSPYFGNGRYRGPR